MPRDSSRSKWKAVVGTHWSLDLQASRSHAAGVGKNGEI